MKGSCKPMKRQINPFITLTGTKSVEAWDNSVRKKAEAVRAEKAVRAEAVRADRRAERLAENFGKRALS